MYLTNEEVEVKFFNKKRMVDLGIIANEEVTEYEFHYATTGACAFDLYSVINSPVILYPFGGPISVSTGIGVQIYNKLHSFGLLVLVRSSMTNFGVVLANQVGLIDSDYQGEIICKLLNTNRDHRVISIKPGERFAQAILFPVWRLTKGKIVDEFSRKTARGEGGFGHTGRQGLTMV